MNPAGRPRKHSIDQDILDAVAELVVELGYPRVTVDRIVERAGTNKPAFYRRYPNLAAVVPRLLAARHGTDEDIDTGSLVGDLVEVQRRQRELFTDPVVRRGFSGWLAEVDAEPANGAEFLAGYLAPRRAFTRTIIARAVERGEIEGRGIAGEVATSVASTAPSARLGDGRDVDVDVDADTDADAAWIADLLTGPLLMHVVMPGLAPIDDALVSRTVHAALDALGYCGDRTAVGRANGSGRASERGPEAPPAPAEETTPAHSDTPGMQ